MALTRRARRSNCSGWTSFRDALCGSSIRRDRLDGGFCQGIVSKGSCARSGSWSVWSDLNRTTSLSVCTTIAATNRARASGSRNCKGLDVEPCCWTARCASRDLTMVSSMSAAGTRKTDPADAVLASPAGQGPTHSSDIGCRPSWRGWGSSDGRHRQTAVPSATDQICCARRCGGTIGRARACLVSGPAACLDDTAGRLRDAGFAVFWTDERVAALGLDLGLFMGSSEVMRRHPPHHLSPARQSPGRATPKPASAAPSHHSNAPIRLES
jgi:hypothetical protein